LLVFVKKHRIVWRSTSTENASVTVKVKVLVHRVRNALVDERARETVPEPIAVASLLREKAHVMGLPEQKE
jgi:hypothetical protein